MKSILLGFAAAALAICQTPSPPPKVQLAGSVSTFLEVRRIYVDQLSGGPQADALRELIIASIDGTKLFVLTDNPERADAVLKGAADDHAFTDSFDSDESISGHENAGKSSTGSSLASKSGLYGGVSAADHESHHIRERKHEAYAAVRLCNRDGDVLWSTTQESDGAKFRGASADVAAKIARQLTLDFDRSRRTASNSAHPASGETK